VKPYQEVNTVKLIQQQMYQLHLPFATWQTWCSLIKNGIYINQHNKHVKIYTQRQNVHQMCNVSVTQWTLDNTDGTAKRRKPL